MNQMKITYREVNGYLIPNLKLPLEEASVRLGKWGRLHKDYLIKHKQSLLTILFSEGQLYSYLANIDRQAQEMRNKVLADYVERDDANIIFCNYWSRHRALKSFRFQTNLSLRHERKKRLFWRNSSPEVLAFLMA